MSNGQDDLGRLLEQLVNETRPLPISRLYVLSDLHGQGLERFFNSWSGLPADRRRWLVRSLGELAESSFEVTFDAIFRRCLDDPDDRVRAAAVDGLWECESPSLIGPFIQMLRTDPSVQVRASAARGLGRFVLAGELEQLEQPLQARIVAELLAVLGLAEEGVTVRRRALESVAYACIPEVMDALDSAYDADDEDMRLSAVVGMGRSCDRRWQTILLRELGSQKPAMRYEAALACGGLMLERAVPGLTSLVCGSDREISAAAIWALGQIGGARAREVLIEAYDEADEDTRAAIDDALAEQALLDGDMDLVYNGQGEDEPELDWLVEEEDGSGLEEEGDLDEADEDWLPLAR